MRSNDDMIYNECPCISSTYSTCGKDNNLKRYSTIFTCRVRCLSPIHKALPSSRVDKRILFPGKPADRLVRRLGRVPPPHGPHAQEKHADRERADHADRDRRTECDPPRRLVRNQQAIDLNDAARAGPRRRAAPRQHARRVRAPVRAPRVLDPDDQVAALERAEHDVAVVRVWREQRRVRGGVVERQRAVVVRRVGHLDGLRHLDQVLADDRAQDARVRVQLCQVERLERVVCGAKERPSCAGLAVVTPRRVFWRCRSVQDPVHARFDDHVCHRRALGRLDELPNSKIERAWDKYVGEFMHDPSLGEHVSRVEIGVQAGPTATSIENDRAIRGPFHVEV